MANVQGQAVKVLHIGFPKTGTTWVQSQLLKLNFEEEPPFIFGQSREAANSTFLRCLHRLVRGMESPEDITFLRNQISRGFVISAETILGNSTLSMPERISKLKLVFPPQTRVVITYRNFAELLVSLYQEEVKNKLYSSEDQFLGVQTTGSQSPWSDPWNVGKLDFRSLVSAALDSFDEVILVDAKNVMAMDWLVYAVHQFDSRVGIDAQLHDRRQNVRLRNWQVHFLERLNAFLTYLSPDVEILTAYGTPLSEIRFSALLRELPLRIGTYVKRAFLIPTFAKFLPFGNKFESASLKQYSLGMNHLWDVEEIRNQNPNGSLVVFD